MEPENLGETINTQFNEFEPWVAPDESFLIFMCGGRADGKGGFDLYLSYNRDRAWTKPVNLGDKINFKTGPVTRSLNPSLDNESSVDIARSVLLSLTGTQFMGIGELVAQFTPRWRR